MKNLLLLLLPLILIGCNNGPNEDEHYINVDCIIVKKITNKAVGDKTTKAFLIRMVNDTTLYSEYVSIDGSYYMRDSTWYGHSVGDTLHFDYIGKNRFFKSNVPLKEIIKDLGAY